MNYKRIVVPIDGSGWSARAIPHAARLAKQNKAELILLHIYDAPQAAVDSARDRIRQILREHRDKLVEEGIEARGYIIEGRNPAGCICQYVRAAEVDLVVMSTHGRTGIARMLFGSVAHEVIRELEIPVLLVRPNQTQEIVLETLPPGEDI